MRITLYDSQFKINLIYLILGFDEALQSCLGQIRPKSLKTNCLLIGCPQQTQGLNMATAMCLFNMLWNQE